MWVLWLISYVGFVGKLVSVLGVFGMLKHFFQYVQVNLVSVYLSVELLHG